MPRIESASLENVLLSLIPSLSRELSEHFNVFRVMHHGTHEKQISNVFAWLLHADGTHELGDTFQRIFVEHVNRILPDGSRLPDAGYRVRQEVDTAERDSQESDIADIVLSSSQASMVVENYYSTDGHGHDYDRYRAHGAAGGRQSAVVVLCAMRELHRLKDGWEQASVVTYSDLLDSLRDHVAGDKAWQQSHPEQHFFLRQLFDHFLEGSASMTSAQQIKFIKAMCESGESARYGQRPHERAALNFAEEVGQHTRQQFEASRDFLGQLKRALIAFTENVLKGQVNKMLGPYDVTSVYARYVGQWEWATSLMHANSDCNVHLEFGPTAVVENGRVPEPIEEPDYAMVFVTRGTPDGKGIDRIAQTTVSLEELLAGLSADDTRLRDAVLGILSSS